MALVKVVNPDDGKEYEYYMDDKLKKQLDLKVIPSLEQKDEDYIICVDGAERGGKSVFSFQLARYVDPTFSIDKVNFDPNEFRQAILNARHGQAIVFDEAYRGMSASGSLTEVNKVLKGLSMEMGQKNLFVIIVLPSFYLLEKYFGIWRTKGVFHIFKSKGRKGYWRYFNQKKKKILYLKGKKDYTYYHVKTGFKGRFYNYYCINEEEYRKKKGESLRKGFRVTKTEHYMEQRNRMILILRKELKLKVEELEKMLNFYKVKIRKSQIAEILKQLAIKEGISLSLEGEKDIEDTKSLIKETE